MVLASNRSNLRRIDRANDTNEDEHETMRDPRRGNSEGKKVNYFNALS